MHAQTLDQVEHRSLQGVRVLEHDQHRVIPSKSIDHGEEPGLHVMYERGLVAALALSEQPGQTLHRSGRVGCPFDAVDKLTEPGPDRGWIVARADAREVADDRGRWGEGRGVGVGACLSAEDHDRRAHARRELVGQARLADAGLTYDSHEHRTAVRACEAKALSHDGLLAGTTDEWNRPPD